MMTKLKHVRPMSWYSPKKMNFEGIATALESVKPQHKTGLKHQVYAMCEVF